LDPHDARQMMEKQYSPFSWKASVSASRNME
jgi:hypothetical protein